MTVLRRPSFRTWRSILIAIALLAVCVAMYVRTHPLVFMDVHVHCIKAAGLELSSYADMNDGRFPIHKQGYGNALLLLPEHCYHVLTGPGYDAEAFRQAKRSGACLSDENCGRVYVQGLNKKNSPDLALLFDKLPTPGGDHCHLPIRLWAPLGREVWLLGGGMTFVQEGDWTAFAKNQVDLLVKEGFDRSDANRLYALQ